jgi:gluconate kinase
MQSRDDHYMKPEMLKSQFELLEPPKNALAVNIDQSVSEIVQEIIDFVVVKFDLT